MAVQVELGRVSCFFVVSRFRGLVDIALSASRHFIFFSSEKTVSFHHSCKSLTDLSSSHHCPLFRIQSFLAGRSFKELDKTIRLFDRHLRQFAVFVENME